MNSRPLGQLALTALVVGNMIGSGVFLLPAALAPYGAASLLGWAPTLAGALLLALVYAWLARTIRNHGGAYGYARCAFGDGIGFVVAWSYWVCTWSANAAIAVAFAGSLGALWPAATATPLRAATCALGALWLCTAVNLAGVREAARVQLLTTLLKLVPLVLFGLAGLAWVHAAAYRPFNPSGLPLPGVASSVAALTLWAMLGFEAATVPTGVVRDPERTVPRATVIGMLLAGLATMLACTVVIGLLPGDELQRSAAPMVVAAARTWGPAAGVALAMVATISCFGALNGWVLLQAQTPLAAAQDGLFPARFGRLDGRGTPAFGLLSSSVLASALIAANYSRTLVGLFTFSILLSTATTLLPYVVSVLAWWRIEPGAARWRRLVAIGALGYALWALVGTGIESLLWAAVLVAAGLPVLLWQRRKAIAR
ncbi:amino acid permease [Frateuria hangzhouensis]|uniref:amino acid permease n=1 Tax=Frateuria hangzhouensis TaxID=2995589 RepID=UPI002260D931|nr:amino acid permease [Frateuria sp. STR12]MCX7513560.1 amino acid permease [Frateuria sp. STR12]